MGDDVYEAMKYFLFFNTDCKARLYARLRHIFDQFLASEHYASTHVCQGEQVMLNTDVLHDLFRVCFA
jgi:hypothetical protein